MNFLYIIMSIAFGYWLGTPSKNITPIVNCPVAEQSKDPGQVHESKPSAPVVVEPIDNKKSSPSPSPTPEIKIDDPQPQDESEGRRINDNLIEAQVRDMARDVMWRQSMTDVEDKLVRVVLDNEEYKYIETYRKKIAEARMIIVEERALDIASYVYELKVGPINQ